MLQLWRAASARNLQSLATRRTLSRNILSEWNVSKRAKVTKNSLSFSSCNSMQPHVLRPTGSHLPAEFGSSAIVRSGQQRPAVAVLAQLHRTGRSPWRPSPCKFISLDSSPLTDTTAINRLWNSASVNKINCQLTDQPFNWNFPINSTRFWFFLLKY